MEPEHGRFDGGCVGRGWLRECMRPSRDREEKCDQPHPQFQRGFKTISNRKKSPMRSPGAARTHTRTVAMRGLPFDFSHKLPPTSAASPPRRIVHSPLLNEDTEPSARPHRKKNTAIAAITASMPHGIQNFTAAPSRALPRVVPT